MAFADDKKKKKKKKDKGGDDSWGGGDFGGGDLGGGGGLGDFGGGGNGGFGGGGMDDFGGGMGTTSGGLGDFGTGSGGLGGGLDSGDSPHRHHRHGHHHHHHHHHHSPEHVDSLGDAPTLDAILAQERQIRQQLEQESDQFGEAARTERVRDERLEQEVGGLQQQFQELEYRENHLRSEVEAAKVQLFAAREAHRSTDLHDLTAAADRTLVAEELEFLERKVADDSKTMNFMSNANIQLQRHNEDLRQQVLRLERERKIVGNEVTQEREESKVEARQLAELRNMVDQLQRQRQAKHYHQSQDQLLQSQLHNLKHAKASPTEGHSWAKEVSTPGPSGQSASNTAAVYGSSPPRVSPTRGMFLGLRGSGQDF